MATSFERRAWMCQIAVNASEAVRVFMGWCFLKKVSVWRSHSKERHQPAISQFWGFHVSNFLRHIDNRR